MSRPLLFLLVSITCFASYGQENPALIAVPASPKLDKTSAAVGNQMDSIESVANVNRFKDSVKIHRWSDSLRLKIDNKLPDAVISRKIDSLKSLKLPAERFTYLSDSILNKKKNLLSEVSSKQQELQKRMSSRYDTWTTTARQKFNLDSAGLKVPGLNNELSGVGDPIQNTNLPTGQMPSADLPAIPSLQSQDFSSLGMSSDLTRIGGIPSTEQLGSWDKNLPSMPDPMKEFSNKTNDLKAVTSDPGSAAEKAVGQLGEVNSATKELQQAEQLKQQNEALKMADQMKDPDALKETAKKEAVNHFMGQEVALQGAMSQMAKYKKKYPSLGSLSEIKKNDWLPTNGLKGKPFRERFRIGLHTGFKSVKDTLLLDFYPNASYRITGRFEAGLGAIYRVRVQTNDFGFDQRDPVWGMATFVNIKTFKSVFLRLELDGNSFPKSGTTDRPSYRDWKWSFHSGIQTNFKIGKQWTGVIQMLYNFNTNLKDGFPENLALRFGVQYKLPKKKVASIVVK